MKKKFFISVVLFVIISYSLSAATAIFIPIKCPEGSARSSGWIVYEDLNNNSFYDTKTSMDCDGILTYEHIPDLIANQPDTLGTVGEYQDPVIYQFDTYTCEQIYPAWRVIEMDSASHDELYRVESCNGEPELILPGGPGGPGNVNPVKGLNPREKLFDLSGKINVYPNPVNNLLNVKFNNFEFKEDVFVQIFNLRGEITKTVNLQHIGNSEVYTLDISELASGKYYIMIRIGNSSLTIPFSINS